MVLIETARIRRVFDSRGQPTVEVDLQSGSLLGRAAAPSGASTGTHEARALPSGGVEAAVRIFRTDVAPPLVGWESTDQGGLDRTLRRLDGTENFARIGGNVATAVSLANAKLAALAAGKPLYAYLGGPHRGKHLPYPFGNVIGGGRHAVGGTTFQEFLVTSQGPTVTGNVAANCRVHQRVKEKLTERFPDRSLGRGDEGAWVAKMDDEAALSLLADACQEVEHDVGFPVRPALDPAASEFYRDGKYRYPDRALSPDEQIAFVEGLVRRFRVSMLEDPLEQEDFAGFARLTRDLGGGCTIVGDDIFVTNVDRLRRGIELHAANAVLIKPNQIGTLTETRAAVDMAHAAGYSTIISHRSAETTDDTIAQLAVAFGCFGIKTGTVGGERLAKLNELIRIEESLAEH